MSCHLDKQHAQDDASRGAYPGIIMISDHSCSWSSTARHGTHSCVNVNEMLATKGFTSVVMYLLMCLFLYHFSLGC